MKNREQGTGNGSLGFRFPVLCSLFFILHS
jgi:hypothetical protein